MSVIVRLSNKCHMMFLSCTGLLTLQNNNQTNLKAFCSLQSKIYLTTIFIQLLFQEIKIGTDVINIIL